MSSFRLVGSGDLRTCKATVPAGEQMGILLVCF